MDFTEFNLNKNLLKGIKAAGFKECTPVQETSLKETLNKKDVCVQSQTGTGKTAAFLIPIFQMFSENEKEKRHKALIITPTRELAVQIENEAKLLGKHLNFKIGSFYGGVGYTDQEKMLSSGIDVIIGTPGRLIDFSEQRKLNFKDVKILVIDEADRLFDMGFLPDITRMIVGMPPPGKRITMLFSATLSTKVRNLAWKHMHNPAEIEISPENIVVEKISQELYHVGRNEKFKLLLGLLNREKAKNTIIFTNMKVTAQEISQRLEMNGIKCQFIMGDLPQSKRLKIIEKVKSGKIPILVATEVAARGLHIDDVDLVINYDLPEDCENYVHRIGRTARAGKSGRAISLACERYVYSLEAIESLTKFKIPVFWPEEDLFLEDKSEGKIPEFEGKKRSGKKKKEPSGKAARPAERKRRGGVMPSLGKGRKPGHISGPGKKQAHAHYRNAGKHGKIHASHTVEKHPVDFVLENTSVLESRKEKFHFYLKEIILGKIASIFKSSGKNKTEKPAGPKVKASKRGSLEERMEYYKKKYGVNFVPAQELSGKKEINKK